MVEMGVEKLCKLPAVTLSAAMRLDSTLQPVLLTLTLPLRVLRRELWPCLHPLLSLHTVLLSPHLQACPIPVTVHRFRCSTWMCCRLYKLSVPGMGLVFLRPALLLLFLCQCVAPLSTDFPASVVRTVPLYSGPYI